MQTLLLIASFVFLSGAGFGQWSQEMPDSALADRVAFACQLMFYGSGLVWLIVERRRSPQDRLGVGLVLVSSGWVCLSALWSGDPVNVFRRALIFAAMSIYGIYIGTRVPLRQQVAALMTALTCTALASIAWMVVAPDWAQDFTVQNVAWRGVFVTKNVLGRSMELGALAAVYMLVQSRAERIVAAVSLAVFSALLYASGSVTAIVGLVAGLGVIALVSISSTSRTVRGLVLASMIAIVPVGAVVIAASGESATGAVNRDTTLTGRTALWSEVVDAAEERPLYGYGYQSFWTADGPAEALWQRIGWRAPHSHNGLLDTWLDVGFVGVALFALVVVVALCRSIAFAATATAWSAWPALVLIMFLMNNVTESTMMKQNSLLWVLALAALMSSAAERRAVAAPRRRFRRAA